MLLFFCSKYQQCFESLIIMLSHFCSKLCAEADWESSHSLLCTGEKSESICREALSKFIQHANGKALAYA